MPKFEQATRFAVALLHLIFSWTMTGALAGMPTQARGTDDTVKVAHHLTAAGMYAGDNGTANRRKESLGDRKLPLIAPDAPGRAWVMMKEALPPTGPPLIPRCF